MPNTLLTRELSVHVELAENGVYRISSIRRPPSNSSPPQIVALPSVD